MRRTIILIAALSIILLGLWGTAVIYFDEDRLKAIVSDRLSEQVGRRVEIVGELRFRLFPSARVVANGLVIYAPEGAPGPATLRADRVVMALRLAPLLRGEFSPGQMQLSGAVISLAVSEEDGDEDPDPLEAIRSSARLLSGRSVRLRDVTVTRPSSHGEGRDSVAIDFVELERFSLDRPVAFRFRGDLGEPAVLEAVEVNGYLMVPASPDSAVRLRDMQLQGRLPGRETTIGLEGDVTTRSDEPFRLILSGGRLRVGAQEFDLSFNYQAGDPPAVDLLFSGVSLDGEVAARFLTQHLGADSAGLLAVAARRVDLRAQAQFDRLRMGPLAFSSTRVDLRSRDGGLAINLSAAFPGGMVDANGLVGAAAPGSLAIDVSLAELSQLFDALDLPAVAGGSGEARLVLHWPGPAGRGFLLEGEADLWQGFWRFLGDDEQPVRRTFDRFNADLRITPGFLELPAFVVQGSDLAGAGWAAVELDSGQVGGEFLAAGLPAIHFGLSGTVARPRLVPTDPADAEPEQQDSQRAETRQ